MSLIHRILLSVISVLLAAGAVSCAGSRFDEPEVRTTSTLVLRVNLAGGTMSRAQEADKEAANDGEKMNTLRVIILDGDNFVEHNSLWTLESPDVQKNGIRFKVKANDTKTIIFVANEDGTVIDVPSSDGLSGFTETTAGAYFGALNPAVGQKVDIAVLRGITMSLNKNLDKGTGVGAGMVLRRPLAINDIYSYAIGEAPEYNATFYIGRAAVKYTFRITNNDYKNDHTVTSLTIGRVAPVQYFFQNAVFTDDNHFFWSSYTTPAAAGSASALTIPCNTVLPKGQTTEVGPFYVPEGAEYGTAYSVGFSFDGQSMGDQAIEWKIPEEAGTDDPGTPMLDLPRNTHVITNVTLNYQSWTLDYTVCPWQVYDITIPDFD